MSLDSALEECQIFKKQCAIWKSLSVYHHEKVVFAIVVAIVVFEKHVA